ncbi:helix-turn-helix transcriptional regulator [Myroides odoratus]|uniref:helix-turn-helix transcriptional regulator n=1 Tax=Myroides odoratus TaxID=256 RepID=UPI000765C280|nr:helix-turn-helix transcriptional regulator [Myroides odoratus]
MKIINHDCAINLDWSTIVAESMGGNVDGKFIRGNNSFYEGTHYLTPIESDIFVMLTDLYYKEDATISYKCQGVEYIGLYFYITTSDVNFTIDNKFNSIGRLNYNFLIIDSNVFSEYKVEKGTSVYSICVFVKRDTLKNIFFKIPNIKQNVHSIFDANQNIIVYMDRMPSSSSALINDFRKISYQHLYFDNFLKGLVYGLLNNYLEKLNTKKIIISDVLNEDFQRILYSKISLLESLEGQFPGIDLLASEVSMSTSKYKKLFLKITGLPPNKFFYTNKLYYSKELLESRNYRVNEIVEKLNYGSSSYFAKSFKKMFGVFPKEYQSYF